MPDYSSFFSKFFKADDFLDGPRTVTIKRIEIEEVGGKDGKPKERKPTLFFEEDDRGVTLNKDRFETCVELFGTKDSDKWIGKKIQLVRDPDIKYGNKKVGGIVFAAAKD